MRTEQSPTDRRAIARCIREQRRCRRYIREHGNPPPPGTVAPKDGGTYAAWLGLWDWLIEEVLIRAELQRISVI
jgi:hypothetical protein